MTSGKICSSLVYKETIFLGNVFLNSYFKCHTCGLVVCFGEYLCIFKKNYYLLSFLSLVFFNLVVKSKTDFPLAGRFFAHLVPLPSVQRCTLLQLSCRNRL